MRVVLVSKALVVGAYQRKAEELARLGVDLTVLAPPAWGDRRGTQRVERRYTQGYQFEVIPIRFNGNFHLHFYPTLARELARIAPQIVHMDEEPYNLATWLGLRAAQHVGAIGTFFTWQNLHRRYPPPFRWLEQANYRYAPVAMAGNQDAATVLRQKGYRGELAIIPQFGVDPEIFCPPAPVVPSPTLRIGYAGGLLPEKGVDLLLRAVAGLRGAWHLHMVGEGSERAQCQQLIEQLGINAQVTLGERLSSAQMPVYYQNLDLLVLPSRTLPTWKEQFGRVLIEAMSSEVVVVGSDSGEIPNVIGAAGLIFHEEDHVALGQHLQYLLDNPAERARLGQAGRQRVLDCYTMASVAQQTVAVYQRLLKTKENNS
ncbi:MAG: glycosyltransferase family 4 protein [Chloroflexi bacterium]|nr:glycosyltransferase family 4 protein [Chloroflexota bacterium]